MDTSRDAAVDRARQAWIARLIDTSRRNNLLYFRDLKTGTIDLKDCHQSAIDRLFTGEEVPLHDFWPGCDLTATVAKVREIRRRAVANEEEKGLQTLFVVIGMASWRATDDGKPPESSVLLVPIAVKGKGAEGRNLALARTGNAHLNLVLLHALETDHGCVIDADDLASRLESADLNAKDEIYAALETAASNVESFTIRERLVIGNFAFQKMSMVQDLRKYVSEIRAHDVIAAIAGDRGAHDAIVGRQVNVDAAEIERTHPDQEFLVVDADSSQQRVVASVVAGSSGVIQGPPGCGKSQTIVNLISTLAARGGRVLFVAEKRAALQVVVERLERARLGHLAVDLHGADISQRSVMERIRQTLDVVRSVTSVSANGVHNRFIDRRRRLNEHERRMHMPRKPSNLSVFEMQSRLLKIPEPIRAKTRWHGAELNRLDDLTVARIADTLLEMQTFSDLLDRTSPSPWLGARISSGADAQAAIASVSRLLGQQLPQFEEAIQALAREISAPIPHGFAAADALITITSEVNQLLELYGDSLFMLDLEELDRDVLPGVGGSLNALVAWLTNSRYRAARRELRTLRRSAAAIGTIAQELKGAIRLKCEWSKVTSQPICRRVVHLDAARDARQAVRLALNQLSRFVDVEARGNEMVDIRDHLSALASDSVTPFRIPRFSDLQREVQIAGASDLLVEIRLSRATTDTWVDLLHHAWLTSCLDAARASDPGIASFDGRSHDIIADEFRHLDRQRTDIAIDRVRRAHAERVIAVMNSFPDQAAIVRREAEKKTRHIPLRKLIAQAPDVLLALCPCWMASPLSISQLVPGNRRYFDYVLLDEASQVFPEDAVPAILRAEHVVVAGDGHQLPPTTFFADGGANGDGDDGDDVGTVEGFQSILNQLSPLFLPWWLEWHYRSRDERLIAFSNHHIYGDRLITFPGAGGESSISHELVDAATGRDGDEDSSSPEVLRVVELILEHARYRPDESLGVIAMGIKHARRIEAALDAALQRENALEEFFATDRRERFFVKNLERVQGDERDAIILSIGYGKDRGGNLPFRFGPLLYEGGERRLNVAITRAKRRLTLVSSFTAADMDPGRIRAEGVRLLRLYLQYAATSGRLLGENARATVPLNDFEEDCYQALTANGIPLEPQWGASQYRIDLAAKHPTRPGRFVLAIECDGASYHSAPTARDRDRLRQQHLQALGWRFHRIWSTDWFQRRETEIVRARVAYERAVAACDADDEQDLSRSDPQRKEPAAAPISTRKLPRPQLPVLRNITAYSDTHLDSVIRYVQSDGLLRSDAEIVSLAARELPFQQVGSRIRQRLQAAIDRTRSSWASGR